MPDQANGCFATASQVCPQFLIGHVQFCTLDGDPAKHWSGSSFFLKKKQNKTMFVLIFLFWSLDIGWWSPRTVSVVPFQESILVILFPISLTIVRSLDHLYEIQNSHRFQTSTSKCKHSDLNPNIIVRAFSLISI